MLPYSKSYKPNTSSKVLKREQAIMERCAVIAKEIRHAKEDNTNKSQWRVRRLQRSLFQLTSSL
jgi:hypothetical protein